MELRIAVRGAKENQADLVQNWAKDSSQFIGRELSCFLRMHLGTNKPIQHHCYGLGIMRGVIGPPHSAILRHLSSNRFISDNKPFY